MQSKGVIKLLAILLAIACAYQLSFTFKTRSVEKKAAQYAAQFPLELQSKMEQHYLDSVQNLPVYNVGFKTFTYKESKEKELNLGLDLRGGMNVMLEVQVQDVIKTFAGNNQNDAAFTGALAEADEAMRKGASNDYIGDFAKAYRRLSNGRTLSELFLTYSQDGLKDKDGKALQPGASDAEIESSLQRESQSIIDASYNVIQKRIDNLGVAQPNIIRMPNSHRILVELPGVKEPQRVRDLLQGAAKLQFWKTFNANEMMRYMSAADKFIKTELKDLQADTTVVAEAVVAEQTPAGEVIASETVVAEQALAGAQDLIAEVAAADSTKSSPSTEAAVTGRYDRTQNPLFALLDPSFAGGASVGAAYKADKAAIDAYLNNPAVRELFPAEVKFLWGVKGDNQIDGRFYLYAIKDDNSGKPALEGTYVTDASEQYAQRGAAAEVSMNMNGEGVEKWAELTGANVGKCIAIVLDDYVYSAPVVNQKIDKGTSQISGNFTIQEAKDLANVLKSGKVRAGAKIIQDTVVGPSLGQEAIDAGMMSFIIAFILVLLYMGLFYKTAGWMADLALITNVFLLMGVLVSFGAVLTLPGIAGIVLTMGMAVDANVIIYERIKEELRGGKGLSLAIKEGFSKAYSAIIDGNLTTIITGVVLFAFGNGPVRGFATTLIIGIITSFFCSVFITRILIEWVANKWGSISFSYKWSENFMNNTHFDFIRVRKVGYMIACAVIALSAVSFGVRKLNMGAEFTGGRAYVIRFDKPVSAEEVRNNVANVFSQVQDADASSISFEVKQYGNENQMRIVTQYKYADQTDEATQEVERIIYDALKPLFSYDISFEHFRSTQNDVNGIVTADMIGPSIAKDMTWNAIYSVLFSLVAIGLYITFRFKRWQWATGATSALAFNGLFVIGLFSMLYGLVPFNLEVNQAFIAAILTIIGYSINDTVVIFDRIREYLGLYPKRNLKDNVNNAINSTLSRTINTSGTTLVTLLAIFFFGGETIRGFIFALTVGIVVGTLSTIFIATPIAYDLMTKRAKVNTEE